MIWSMIIDPPEKKRQALILLVGVTALVFVDIITVTKDLPIRWLNHGALLCLPLLLSYAYCVYKFDLINILPLAKTNLFDQLPAPVYVIESSGRIIAMNSYAKKYIALDAMRSFIDSFKLQVGDLNQDEDLLFIHKNPEEQKFQVKVNVLENRHGNVIGYTLVLMDITAIQQSNERLNELILLKDKVFSVLAHDVSSNLAGIELLTDVTSMQLQNGSFDKIEGNISQLKSGVRSAKSVLSSLLTWVRKDHNESPQLFLAQDAINLAIEDTFPSSSNKDISLDVNLEKVNQLTIYQDQEMLRSAVRNILTNAVKFSPQNGKISVTATADNDSWSLHIKDQGPGMSLENVQRINAGKKPTKAKSESSEGFGLGLSVVQDYLHNNDSSLKAEKIEDGFIMTLQFSKPTKLGPALPE